MMNDAEQQQQNQQPTTQPLVKERLEIANSDADSPEKFNLLGQIAFGMSSIRSSPRELYLAYIVNFFDSYSYFSFSLILTLFLSEDIGFTDVQAGFLYGLWGSLISIYGILVGPVVDNFGVSRSLQIGYLISLVARIGIFLTTFPSA